MRIAYVSLHWPRTRDSGVGKKIQSQIAAWRKMGHEVCLFMHTAEYKTPADLIDANYFFYNVTGKVRTEFNRVAAARQMFAALQDFLPDIIYLRYGIYVYPLHLLSNIACVIEEINTNDLTQHEGLGLIYSVYNRLTRGILFRRIHGLITVSRELANSSAFAGYHKPTQVIANGINLKEFPLLPAPANKNPRVVFIGNPGYAWHGMDKLVMLARLTPDVHLDIIGYHELPELEPLPANISLHGYLGFQDYIKVLEMADVAISSLALHRVHLEEASPLKSRECLAFGLPLVIAYVDTDLDDLNFDFILRIPNKEDNIQTHAQVIRDFAYRMRGVRVERKLVERLDQLNKELKRIAFFEGVLLSKSKGSVVS
ncbi:MAG: glycosyltransferase family 4 protein [Anaerolineales bacterium]|nr:glycosyltransferase family 4 protein [Anaerolineales bacterium]